jgi:hypothetical protein
MSACGISQRNIGMMCPKVFSEVKCPVDAKEITTAHNAAGIQYRSLLIRNFSQQIHPHRFLVADLFDFALVDILELEFVL